MSDWEEFEKWYYDEWSHGETQPAHHQHKQFCYQAWQAALASRTAPTQAGEPVSCVAIDCDNGYASNGGICEMCDGRGILYATKIGKSEDQKKIDKLQSALAVANSSLAELVRLKDYKDHFGKDEPYEAERPIAWENAKEALKKISTLTSEGV